MLFRSSTPEITAHFLGALGSWRRHLDPCHRPVMDGARARAEVFLRTQQRGDGSWVPLWFGNEQAPGEENPVQINRQELAHIIEARVAEIFSLTLQEIKRSGYDGLLPAGMVLTGGASAMPGIKRVAGEVLGMPVRVAQPENLSGLVDRLNSPAYSTSVGLLRWVLSTQDVDADGGRSRKKKGERMNLGVIRKIVGRILP